eukprot:489518_1
MSSDSIKDILVPDHTNWTIFAPAYDEKQEIEIRKKRIADIKNKQIKDNQSKARPKQYLSIFKSIKSLELPNNQCIPSIVCQQIAEYVTTMVENCRNKQCTNNVVSLKLDDDIKTGYFDVNTLAWFYNKNYRYSGCDMDDKATCYCSECMIHTKICGCWEGTIFLLNNPKCESCQNKILKCDSGSCEKSYDNKCNQCEKMLCDFCCEFCDRCYGVFCSQCYDVEKKRKFVVWKCETNGCDNAVYTKHEMCMFGGECDYNFDHVEYCEYCGIYVCTKCEHYVEKCDSDYEPMYYCKDHNPKIKY